MSARIESATVGTGAKRRRGAWAWVGLVSLIAFVSLLIIGQVMVNRAGPILKGRVIETLSTRFQARVELEGLNVSVFRGLDVSGDRLRIYPPDDVVAAGATQPLIALQHFSFHSGLFGLFFKPMHLRTVKATGLQIHIPPREMLQQASAPASKHRGKMKMAVDEIICENSSLVIGTAKPDKDPKRFELQHIVLRDVGPNAPMRYEATLTNAIPPGLIHSVGLFGPWETATPGDSFVSGHYTFDRADLNAIKGISGILASVGDFKGQLDKIVVDGTTNTPNFSLDTADRPVPLSTKFHVIVDGTTGDTYLQPIEAKLGETSFTTSGAVVNIKGKGHSIDVDVDVPNGRLQDFLALAVKTHPPVMSAAIRTKTHLHIRPGKESVSKKLSFRGNFTLRSIHFANARVQDKVDMLSLRAEGHPKEAKPGAQDVSSKMSGIYEMQNGLLRFSSLAYTLPGARINLAGVYSLDGQQFDFQGKVFTQATLPHMVASRWKSWLLRTVSPFFHGKDGGAEIPVKISGTRSEPKFGLDWHFGHHSEDGSPKDTR